MPNAINSAAPPYLPSFITAPGETDVLLTAVAIVLVVAVLFLGSLYFWLHSMPERFAHGTSQTQFQLVGVMCLIALFTHNTAFWVAALLLALIPIPDFWTPLATMAEQMTKMAGNRLRRAGGLARSADDSIGTVEINTPVSDTGEPLVIEKTSLQSRSGVEGGA